MDDEEIIEEEYYFPKEAYREKYKKRKAHDEMLRKQVERNGGYYRHYMLITDKRIGAFSYVKVKKPYVCKIYVSSHCERYKWGKREANRKVRRNKDDSYNGGSYKKMWDSWYFD